MIGSKARKGQTDPKDGLKQLRWIWRDGLDSRLVLDGREVGSLQFSGTRGSLAVSKSEKGNWTFKRFGFLRPKVIVRTAGSSSNYAVASMNWAGGGTLEISGGSVFRIKRSGFWSPQLDVHDSSGNEILSLRINRRSDEATVKVQDDVDLPQQGHLLVSLAWYIIVLTMRYENDAGTMAAIVAGAMA
jgi:hypothetical protein